MGGGNSIEWKGYEHQLFNDTNGNQTLEVKDSEEKGCTAIRRHPKAIDGFVMFLKSSEIPNESKDSDNKIDNDIILDSGWKCIQNAGIRYKQNNCFGYRPFTEPMTNPLKRGSYKWDTYDCVLKEIYSVANGLKKLSLNNNSNVGIFAINRPEWMLVHLGNWCISYRTVALYDTLGAEAVRYIITHAELPIIFVEKNKLKNLWSALKLIKEEEKENKEEENNNKLFLKYVVQFDYQTKYNNQHEKLDDNDIQIAADLNIKLLGFYKDFLSDNNSINDELKAMHPVPNDLAYIMYTSGTTGNPKGVKLTHRSFACTVASAYRGLAQFHEAISSKDLHCSYLPLAHSFEAAVIVAFISGGGQIGFWGGNIKTIGDDWKDLRPTVMFGVPRIYNKTYDKVLLKVKNAGFVKQYLFSKALDTSTINIRQNGKRSGFYDKLVWKGVCEQIGFDRLRLLASGAAPLPPFIAEFLRIVCGSNERRCIIVQGYGLTESCAVSFFTSFNDYTLGHIGVPVDNVEYRLIDAPECNYFVTDQPYPRGEIQIRGPTIMDGYYKNEESTAKALNKDGWFSTGDIGRINPNGTLSIIDRRKNMFKTAMGEYIAAERLEILYSKAVAINQLWIYGNSFKSFVVAIVVPDALWLVPILKEKNLWKDENLTPATKPYCDKFKKIVNDNYNMVKKIVVENIRELEKELKLKKFEIIRDFYIESEIDEILQGFNVANDCLTPTFKMRRPQLLQRYKETIKKMYADNGEPAKDDENW